MSLYENLDEIIEANLKLICEKYNGKMICQQLIDEKGKRYKDDRLLAQLMDERGLIEYDFVHKYNCVLTEFGDSVYKNGGWIKYLRDSESERQNQLKKQSDNETLESDLKTLQKESLLYKQTIRNQESRIRDLNEELRFMSLIKHYWWFIGACIGLGYIVREFLDKP